MVPLEDNGTGLKNLTVEGYLYNVEHMFYCMGSYDPRLDDLGKTEFCLSQKLHAYAWDDPPPHHIRPIPIFFLHECWGHICTGNSHEHAITNLLYVVFFFLCWPGKYGKRGNDTRSSHLILGGVQFFFRTCSLFASDAPISAFIHANFISIMFNDQNYAFRGESIGHRRSSHHSTCTVYRILYTVDYLSAQGNPPYTPL